MKRLDFPNFSFTYRILAGSLVVALIPLLLGTFALMRTFEVIMDSKNEMEAKKILTEIDLQLSNFFSEYEWATLAIKEDGTIMQGLLQEEKVGSEEYLQLYKYTEGLRSNSPFILYDANGQYAWGTANTDKNSSLPVDWGLLRKARFSNGMAYYTLPQINQGTGDNPIMRLARCIRNEQRQAVGYIVVTLSRNSLSNMLSPLQPESGNIVVTNNFWELIYSARNNFTQADAHSFGNDLKDAPMTVMEKNKNFITMYQYNSKFRYYLIVEQPTGLSGSAVDILNIICFVVVLISIPLCVGISLLISKNLSKPVKQLTAGMKEVQKGNLDVRVTISRSDELGRLTESFNSMAEKMQRNTTVLVERQKQLNEAQIRQFQAQLNPHFLYNTLDTLKWIAKINQVEGIAEIVENLAVILRRSIGWDQFVTLAHELDTTKCYIDIQQIRFSGKFAYSTDVEERLQTLYVPKLILQPIVENAIIHGFKDVGIGHIHVAAHVKEDLLRIEVSDDGCGISEDKQEKLLTPDLSPSTREHMGIYNVHRIIQLQYGDRYGLVIVSELGYGTTVTAILPVSMTKTEEG